MKILDIILEKQNGKLIEAKQTYSFPENKRDFDAYIRSFTDKNTKKELQVKHNPIYYKLWSGGLLDKFYPPKKPITKNEIKKYIKDNNITLKSSDIKGDTRSLSQMNRTYYVEAWKNGWLDDLFPKESDKKILNIIKKFIKDNNLTRSTFRYKKYYHIAISKNWMDLLFPPTIGTKDEFIKTCKKVHKGREYDYTDIDFKGTGYEITIICHRKDKEGDEHGPFTVRAGDHKIGKGQCKKCLCQDRTENFIEKSIEKHGNKYGYDKVDFCNPIYQVKDTKSGKNKHKWYFPIYCETHKTYFRQRSDIHLAPHGCPYCAESQGESAIKKTLDEMGLKYSPWESFDFCTNQGYKGRKCADLEFDVYIPEMKTIIEYDGGGHFGPIDYFGGQDTFTQVVHYDNLKNEFCEGQYNIRGTYIEKLIRISDKTPINEIPSEVKRLIMSKRKGLLLSKNYPSAGWNGGNVNESKLSLMNIYKEIN